MLKGCVNNTTLHFVYSQVDLFVNGDYHEFHEQFGWAVRQVAKAMKEESNKYSTTINNELCDDLLKFR